MKKGRSPAFGPAGLVLLLTAAAFAGDSNITTDPLAAALMPKPHMGSSMFMPSFIRPLGRNFNFEIPYEMQTPDEYPTPGVVSRTPQLPIKVFLTVPPSNSVFPRNSIVTMGWLPASQPISDGDPPNKPQYPIRYEIYITRHDRWSTRLFVKERPTTRYYTYLFTPPGPGRYHWHVRSIYTKEMHGHNSDVRSFLVLP